MSSRRQMSSGRLKAARASRLQQVAPDSYSMAQRWLHNSDGHRHDPVGAVTSAADASGSDSDESEARRESLRRRRGGGLRRLDDDESFSGSDSDDNRGTAVRSDRGGGGGGGGAVRSGHRGVTLVANPRRRWSPGKPARPATPASHGSGQSAMGTTESPASRARSTKYSRSPSDDDAVGVTSAPKEAARQLETIALALRVGGHAAVPHAVADAAYETMRSIRDGDLARSQGGHGPGASVAGSWTEADVQSPLKVDALRLGHSSPSARSRSLSPSRRAAGARAAHPRHASTTSLGSPGEASGTPNSGTSRVSFVTSRDVDWAMTKIAMTRRRQAEKAAAEARRGMQEAQAELTLVREALEREHSALADETKRALRSKSDAERAREEEESALAALVQTRRDAEAELSRRKGIMSDAASLEEAVGAARHENQALTVELDHLREEVQRLRREARDASGTASTAQSFADAQEARVDRVNRLVESAELRRTDAEARLHDVLKELQRERDTLAIAQADREAEIEAAERIRSDRLAIESDIKQLERTRAREEEAAKRARAEHEAADAKARSSEARARKARLEEEDAVARAVEAAKEADTAEADGERRARLAESEAEERATDAALKGAKRVDAASKDAVKKVEAAREEARQLEAEVRAEYERRVAAVKAEAAKRLQEIEASIKESEDQLTETLNKLMEATEQFEDEEARVQRMRRQADAVGQRLAEATSQLDGVGEALRLARESPDTDDKCINVSAEDIDGAMSHLSSRRATHVKAPPLDVMDEILRRYPPTVTVLVNTLPQFAHKWMLMDEGLRAEKVGVVEFSVMYAVFYLFTTPELSRSSAVNKTSWRRFAREAGLAGAYGSTLSSAASASGSRMRELFLDSSEGGSHKGGRKKSRKASRARSRSPSGSPGGNRLTAAQLDELFGVACARSDRDTTPLDPLFDDRAPRRGTGVVAALSSPMSLVSGGSAASPDSAGRGEASADKNELHFPQFVAALRVIASRMYGPAARAAAAAAKAHVMRGRRGSMVTQPHHDDKHIGDKTRSRSSVGALRIATSDAPGSLAAALKTPNSVIQAAGAASSARELRNGGDVDNEDDDDDDDDAHGYDSGSSDTDDVHTATSAAELGLDSVDGGSKTHSGRRRRSTVSGASRASDAGSDRPRTKMYHEDDLDSEGAPRDEDVEESWRDASEHSPMLMLFKFNIVPLAARSGKTLVNMRAKRHAGLLDLEREQRASVSPAVRRLLEANSSQISSIMQFYAQRGQLVMRQAVAHGRKHSKGVAPGVSLSFKETLEFAKDWGVVPNIVSMAELKDLFWLINKHQSTDNFIDLLSEKEFPKFFARLAVRVRMADEDVDVSEPTDGSTGSAAARRLKRTVGSAADLTASGFGDSAAPASAAAKKTQPGHAHVRALLAWLNRSPGLTVMRTKSRHNPSLTKPFVI